MDVIISNHRDSLGACKGEHGGLCLRVQKVRDTGMGDPVVGFWLGVQKYIGYCLALEDTWKGPGYGVSCWMKRDVQRFGFEIGQAQSKTG